MENFLLLLYLFLFFEFFVYYVFSLYFFHNLFVKFFCHFPPFSEYLAPLTGPSVCPDGLWVPRCPLPMVFLRPVCFSAWAAVWGLRISVGAHCFLYPETQNERKKNSVKEGCTCVVFSSVKYAKISPHLKGVSHSQGTPLRHLYWFTSLVWSLHHQSLSYWFIPSPEKGKMRLLVHLLLFRFGGTCQNSRVLLCQQYSWRRGHVGWGALPHYRWCHVAPEPFLVHTAFLRFWTSVCGPSLFGDFWKILWVFFDCLFYFS